MFPPRTVLMRGKMQDKPAFCDHDRATFCCDKSPGDGKMFYGKRKRISQFLDRRHSSLSLLSKVVMPMSPRSMPNLSHFMRCWLVPCVKLSGWL